MSTINYNLNQEQKSNIRKALRKMLYFLRNEKRNLFIAFWVMLLNAGISMLTPYLIGYAIDHYIQTGELKALILFGGFLFSMYLVASGTDYLQTQLMGSIGQRMLYALRNEVFNKLQQLPVAFFNQNKLGDLISRINNDTDSVNQFFSQSLLRFVDILFTMTGATCFMLGIHWELGLATLSPAVFILLFTLLISPWVRRKNAISLKATGSLSAEIQESLQNFKSVVAFNRRDYFRSRFQSVNQINYRTSVIAGVANNLFTPVFGLVANMAQLVVLTYGIYLISRGLFTVGLLISFIAYSRNFYQPLRQLAALWATFQTAMAAWDRISVILGMGNNMPLLQNWESARLPEKADSVIVFQHVSFTYDERKMVLEQVNLQMQRGKTYAFVGPTGGGKSTTAALIARLYDPSEGIVFLNGRDIRSYSPEERTAEIGFILQEPILFSGTLKENILYGNEQYQQMNEVALENLIQEAGLSGLLAHFEHGLDTELKAASDAVSLGQKQLIAFARAVLRKPKVLILDEATANIDTVTEKLLGHILDKLPEYTTRIVIAHRLNTIENADEIFFVNAGRITAAGTLDQALKMLLAGKRES